MFNSHTIEILYDLGAEAVKTAFNGARSQFVVEGDCVEKNEFSTFLWMKKIQDVNKISIESYNLVSII